VKGLKLAWWKAPSSGKKPGGGGGKTIERKYVEFERACGATGEKRSGEPSDPGETNAKIRLVVTKREEEAKSGINLREARFIEVRTRPFWSENS